jgi:SOS-response transcriptional repressor LexA
LLLLDIGVSSRMVNPDPPFDRTHYPLSNPQGAYSLQVLGDSMVGDSADAFPEGSIIRVEPALQALPGDYVIALIGENETTFRQLVSDGGELFLKPLNPRYPTQPLGNGTVLGVVRELSKRIR